MMAFAAGDRQMLPRQIKSIFVLSISLHFDTEPKGTAFPINEQGVLLQLSEIGVAYNGQPPSDSPKMGERSQY